MKDRVHLRVPTEILVEHVVEDLAQAAWSTVRRAAGPTLVKSISFENLRSGFRRFIWTRVRGIAASGRGHRILSLASGAGELDTLSLECAASVACDLEPVFAAMPDALEVANRIAEKIERILGRFRLDPVAASVWLTLGKAGSNPRPGGLRAATANAMATIQAP